MGGHFVPPVFILYPLNFYLLNIDLHRMKYLSTEMATNWPEESLAGRLLKVIFFFIPKANPGYDSKMYRVKKWLVEFLEEDGMWRPWREIALDASGDIVFAGPDQRNYGFWLDTNMKYEDFEGEPIERELFEQYWSRSGAVAPNL